MPSLHPVSSVGSKGYPRRAPRMIDRVDGKSSGHGARRGRSCLQRYEVRSRPRIPEFKRSQSGITAVVRVIVTCQVSQGFCGCEDVSG